MIGEINMSGELMIKRYKHIRLAACPYSMPVCNDKCPLFGEPMPVGKTGKETDLEICKKILKFTEFTDNREKEDG